MDESKGSRILLVEDEESLAIGLEYNLSCEGYEVIRAGDGRQALKIFNTQTFDLIILDIMLPYYDGFEVAKKIREQSPQMPILMLTARTATKDRIQGLEAGADDYLTKPFSFEELLARVRALCRRPKSSLATILSVADLKLDPVKFEVTRHGKLIQLSSKEFSLLEYLMRHPGQVLSKEQIIGHVWNYEADVLPNTVEVYIGYLRNKIDKALPRLNPLIQTVRGFGYKLMERSV
jgi:DNA-binding response OmpR family regulator